MAVVEIKPGEIVLSFSSLALNGYLEHVLENSNHLSSAFKQALVDSREYGVLNIEGFNKEEVRHLYSAALSYVDQLYKTGIASEQYIERFRKLSSALKRVLDS